MSILAGVLAARAAKAAFVSLWSLIDDREPPKPTAPDANLREVVMAAALESGTKAAIGAASERMAAQTFNYLFGVWPGEKPRRG
jgi:hypothetical protein